MDDHELPDEALLDALADALRAPDRQPGDDRVADLRRQAEERGLLAAAPSAAGSDEPAADSGVDHPSDLVSGRGSDAGSNLGIGSRPDLGPVPRSPRQAADEQGDHAVFATARAPQADTADDRFGRTARRRAEEARRQRSRRAVLRGGVAAAVGAVAGASGVYALTANDDGGGGDGPPTQPVAFASVPDGLTAEGRTIDHTWGMELLLDVAGLPDGAEYEVRYATDAGPVSAGGFRAVADVTMHCRFNGTALRAAVTGLDVVDTATGTPILRGTLA